MAQYDLNLRDYWRILRKRKWLCVFVTVAFGVMAFAFAKVQQPNPVYQAMAVVKYERTTTLVGLLVESISIASGDSLATQAAVVRSFPVLERAAKALRLIPAELDSDAIKRNPRYVQLLGDLRSQVAAAPEENTTLINITVTSSDPKQAARLANAVAQAYQDENSSLRNRQIQEARRFIEEQVTEVGGRLRQAEDGIRTLKEQRGFVSLTDETTAASGRLTNLEGEYERIRRVQQETANQIQALQDPQVVAGTVTPRIFTDASDPTIGKLNSTLLDLAVERENLLLTLTSRHPQVVDLQARIASARESLVRELRLKLRTFQDRSTDLNRQIQEIRTAQRALPELGRQFAQFQRELTLNETLLASLRTKLQEVQIKEKEQVAEVSLVRPAIEPSQPTNPPQTTGKTIVGLLIGLTVGLVLAFVLESMDTSIGTIQDVESYLEVPVLGLIPNIDAARDPFLAPPEGEERDSPLAKMRPFLICLLNPRSTVAESYRSLRTNVEFLTLEKQCKVLCLTSASLMEGKTTTAINLAITIAQMGKKTLLVEADLRKPFLHHAFGLPRDPGLTEVIIGNKDWRECLRTVTDLMLGPLGVENIMATPNIDKLYLLTSGTPPPNPTEFLNSQRMTDLIAAFRQEFDFVIFDCPPILPVTDAAILASKTDGCLIVYRVGKIARSALKRSKVLLENVRGRVLGMILTGLKAEISPDYEELQYYRYAYGHEPQRTPAMSTARQTGRSFSAKIAGLFRRPKGAGKTPKAVGKMMILIVPFGLALAGAWWYGGGTAWLARTQIAIPESVASPAAPVAASVLAENRPAVPIVMASLPPQRPGQEDTSARPLEPATAPQGAMPAPAAPSTSPTIAPELPATLEPQATPASQGGAARPFSLRVASFHSRARSLTYSKRLRQQGLEAFTVPAEIPGKPGPWYRVLVGRFETETKAREAARELSARGTIGKNAEILSLGFVVEVPDLNVRKMNRAATIVKQEGYLPALPPSQNGRPSAQGHIMLVEAFGTAEEAQGLTNLLRAAGMAPRLVPR